MINATHAKEPSNVEKEFPKDEKDITDSDFGVLKDDQQIPTPTFTGAREPEFDSYEYRKKRMRDPTLRFLKVLPCFGIIPAIGIAAVLTWMGVRDIPNNKYCLVLDDDFSSFNKDTWTYEYGLGGFGNGDFIFASDNASNAYVSDGKLHIVPRLSEETFGADAMYNGYTLNLTDKGCKSSKPWEDCWVVSNSTNHTVLPPVQSARITTKNSVSIKYGRVEIKAKIPKGDWIWPGIWMHPKDSVYGEWPASGEIDIMESRGNPRNYSEGGIDKISSTLHWGLVSDYDRYKDTQKQYALRHRTFNDEYHIFGLEWTPQYLLTWVDSPLRTNLYQKFDYSFWTRGNFPAAYPNGSGVTNPWPLNDFAAPFNQEFFLILNVAVGGTNGYFPDAKGGKSWVDTSPNARYDFLKAKDDWYYTWPSNDADRGMVVDYVKMWKLCN